MVIADTIAIFVNTVFNSYVSYGSVELILAAMSFSVQIYCDFYSYSIIAVGVAMIMGINLMDNFKTPYMSTSLKEFWTRWHISLSTWFRDYVYIPLGGNRCGKVRRYINLFITFLVSGLWHGAAWTYVFWGALHGIFQDLSLWTKNIRCTIVSRLKIKTNCFSYKLWQCICTFICVTFLWIFFRAKTIIDAINYIKRIFTKFNPWVMTDGSLVKFNVSGFDSNILIFCLFILIVVDILEYHTKERLDEILMKQNYIFRYIVVLFFVVLIYLFGQYGPMANNEQFIYFQF